MQALDSSTSTKNKWIHQTKRRKQNKKSLGLSPAAFGNSSGGRAPFPPLWLEKTEKWVTNRASRAPLWIYLVILHFRKSFFSKPFFVLLCLRWDQTDSPPAETSLALVQLIPACLPPGIVKDLITSLYQEPHWLTFSVNYSARVSASFTFPSLPPRSVEINQHCQEFIRKK